MKLHYYADTDSLYIELAPGSAADSTEVTAGVVLDFDADGRLIGVDVDRASTRVDLSRLESEGIPYRALTLDKS